MANNYQPAIELKDVTKEFDGVIAVKNINISINKGEFFSLLGPSGCGKTTTLRLIAGLETPTRGKIFLENKNVTNIPAFKRNVNTVFQDYALFPHMNVKKNIYFPLKMKNIPLNEAEPDIKEILNLVSMNGFENRLPQQLSGGQRQRIALARSLINKPAALLLDEPLGALDFKLRIAMQKVLKDIQRNVGITFVYVTHDQTEAMTMSDRIAVLKDGIIHQIGTPIEIYNRPATAFVASFIGDMNFLDGKISDVQKNSYTVDIYKEKIDVKKLKNNFEIGEDIILCIRTEKIAINDTKSKNINKIKSRIKRTIFRGMDYEVTCEINGVEVRSIISASQWNSSLKEGDNVNICFCSDDVIIFSSKEKNDIVKYSVEAI